MLFTVITSIIPCTTILATTRTTTSEVLVVLRLSRVVASIVLVVY